MFIRQGLLRLEVIVVKDSKPTKYECLLYLIAAANNNSSREKQTARESDRVKSIEKDKWRQTLPLEQSPSCRCIKRRMDSMFMDGHSFRHFKSHFNCISNGRNERRNQGSAFINDPTGSMYAVLNLPREHR